ncbi:MAG: TRAP transporter large permease subunit [Gammaproteobacteria bacterium]|nr:TRAP transporter large permease subunit [Gammaproteobacteria bacterium]
MRPDGEPVDAGGTRVLPEGRQRPGSLIGRWAWRLEDVAAGSALACMVLLPLADLVGRELLGGGLAGTMPAVQYLTLAVTFLGAGLAARADKLLSLATASFLPARWRGPVGVGVALVTVGVTAALLLASVRLVSADRQYGEVAVWGIPVWTVSSLMPLAFAVLAGRVIWRASPSPAGRAVVALGLLVPLLLGGLFADDPAMLAWPLGGALLVATALGMPIYAALGGAALLLVWVDGTPLVSVPGESFRLSTSPMLPAIPLFTLAGLVLSAGGSSRRLLRLFTALVGWAPGGLAAVATLVLAFFTPLTGASGVTILALGGLLMPMLVRARYSERSALGLITVSGSIGVLFPPSLPVILYAFYAEVPLQDLFLGGLLPGLLLVAAVAGWGVHTGWRGGAQRVPFHGHRAALAFWNAKWELLLPVLIFAGVLGGYTTLVEAAALAVVYAVVVECVIFRELGVLRDLPTVVVQAATLIGGFMILLGVALALTNYLVLAELPMQVLAWLRGVIESPRVFLMALNLFLIVVGALMDIYSAIIVVVPLLVPLAAAYGLDPVHVGIVFLTNMQLGYLMPPMGENLFLSAYRFDRPLPEVYRSTLPYLVILVAVVLVVTYWPPLTLWLVRSGG